MTLEEKARLWWREESGGEEELAELLRQVRASALEEAACQLVEDVENNRKEWSQRPNFRAHYLAEVKWGAAQALYDAWEKEKYGNSGGEEGSVG